MGGPGQRLFQRFDIALDNIRDRRGQNHGGDVLNHCTTRSCSSSNQREKIACGVSQATCTPQHTATSGLAQTAAISNIVAVVQPNNPAATTTTTSPAKIVEFKGQVTSEIGSDGKIKATIKLPEGYSHGQFRFNTKDSIKSEGSWLGLSGKSSTSSAHTNVSIKNNGDGTLQVELGRERSIVEIQVRDNNGNISTIKLSRPDITRPATTPENPAPGSGAGLTSAPSSLPAIAPASQPITLPPNAPLTQSIDVAKLQDALSVVNPDKGNPYSSNQFKDFNAAIATLSAARESNSLGAYGQTLDTLQKDIIRTTQPYQIEPLLKAALSPDSLAELSVVAKQAGQFWTTKKENLSVIREKYIADANFKAEMDFGWAVKHQHHRGRNFNDQLNYLLGAESQTSTTNGAAGPQSEIVTTDSKELAKALARSTAMRGEPFANKVKAEEILKEYESAHQRGGLINANRDALAELVRENPAALDLLLQNKDVDSKELKELAQNFVNAQSDMRGSSNKASLNEFHKKLLDNPGYATLVDLAYEVNHKSPWYRLGLTKTGSMLEQLKYELGTAATKSVETDLKKFEEAAFIGKLGK